MPKVGNSQFFIRLATPVNRRLSEGSTILAPEPLKIMASIFSFNVAALLDFVILDDSALAEFSDGFD